MEKSNVAKRELTAREVISLVKTKAQLERERRDWLRKERSKPRIEIPALYGESIYVHKRIFERFMKQAPRKIMIQRQYVTGGAGSSLVIEYTNDQGGHGTLELIDLGPMPTG